MLIQQAHIDLQAFFQIVKLIDQLHLVLWCIFCQNFITFFHCYCISSGYFSHYIYFWVAKSSPSSLGDKIHYNLQTTELFKMQNSSIFILWSMSINRNDQRQKRCVHEISEALNAKPRAACVLTCPLLPLREQLEVCQRCSPPARLGQRASSVTCSVIDTQSQSPHQLLCNNSKMWALRILMSFIFY